MRTISSVALLSPAVGTGNVGDHFIELAIRRLLGDGRSYERFSIRSALDDDAIERINATDGAVICGTNLYQRDWHSELTVRDLDRINVPVIPFGIGSSAQSLAEVRVGPDTERMIRALHDHCEIGGVRDEHTAEVVRAQGVANVVVTGCPVLFWAGADELISPTPVERRKVIVTARNWLMHRWPDNVDNPIQLEFLREVLKDLGDVEVVFAVHEEYDRRLLELVDFGRASVVDTSDPADYISLYSDPDVVVLAMRLHAGMLAVANGVPAAFVGHDSRTYAFCELLNLPYIELFHPAAAGQATARIRQLLGGRSELPAETSARFGTLRAAMSGFLRRNGLDRSPSYESAG